MTVRRDLIPRLQVPLSLRKQQLQRRRTTPVDEQQSLEMSCPSSMRGRRRSPMPFQGVGGYLVPEGTLGHGFESEIS